jgi:prophage regulatory protein
MGTHERLLRLPEVCDRTGLSRATLYRLEKRGTFPARVRVTDCAVRWPERAIIGWIEGRKLATAA